jgi:hypothetical protein
MSVLTDLVGIVKRTAVACCATPRPAGASAREAAVEQRIEQVIIRAREQDFGTVVYHLEQRLGHQAAAAVAVIAELRRDLRQCSVGEWNRRWLPPGETPAAADAPRTETRSCGWAGGLCPRGRRGSNDAGGNRAVQTCGVPGTQIRRQPSICSAADRGSFRTSVIRRSAPPANQPSTWRAAGPARSSADAVPPHAGAAGAAPPCLLPGRDG